MCRDAVALMATYLDGGLDRRDAERLEAHLAGCPHCADYLDQLRLTIDALGHVHPEDLPDEMVDELVGLYRRWREP
ncbi:MAG: anti-sigma factor [Acidimicrobiia bacterium]